MKKIPLKYLKIGQELKEILFAKFGNEIEKIIFFGSRNTGKFKRDSDFDYLVVLKNPYDWKLRTAILDEAYEIDLKFNIFTDLKFISTEELSTIKGKQFFVLEAFNSGTVL